MKRVCAWCGVDLGDSQSEVMSTRPITHGLCERCAHHMYAQLGLPLAEYIEGLDAPVVVVDGEGVARTANVRARAFLNKDLDQIEGELAGDVLECAYAMLPGGCGGTMHCSGCTIRNAVERTSTTGHSCVRIPATIDFQEDGGTADLLISTERAGDVVLLRVEEVNHTAA